MTIRRSVIIILSAAALAGCRAEVSTAADSGALDGAVADGGLGDAAPIRSPSRGQAGAASMTTASPAAVAVELARSADALAAITAAAMYAVAPATRTPSVDGLAATTATAVTHAAAPVALTPSADELDADVEAPVPGVALASSIAGIRARVGGLDPEAAEHGPLRVLERGVGVLGLANVRDAVLDASSRAWKGRAVRVLTDVQKCTGRVLSFEYATPWIEKDDIVDLEDAQPYPHLRATLRTQFDSVVAHVVLDDPGACRGLPLLIQDAAQASPRMARTLRRVPRRDAIVEAFRNLPRYEELQDDCMGQGECPLDEKAGQLIEQPVDLRAFQFPGEPTVYVVASTAAVGCGEWASPLSAIFVLERARDAEPVPHRVYDAELGSLLLLLDLGRDGHFELVTRSVGDLELRDETGRSRQVWSTHLVGCCC